MTKTRSEIREGFLTWLRERHPADAERLINATDFGVEVLLLSNNEIREGESLYEVTDSERVEHWCDMMRIDESWARMDGSRLLSDALNAYLRYVEWLDLEQEREGRRGLDAVSHEDGLGGHASKRDKSDTLGNVSSESSQCIELSDEELIKEGEAQEVVMTKYERNPRARQKCIEAYGSTYRCEVCGFNFEEVYGPRDAGQYIEVHHIAEHALRSRTQGRHVIDCKHDLIPLCANCHRMIHHLRPNTLSPDELRRIMEGMSGRHAFKRDLSDALGSASSMPSSLAPYMDVNGEFRYWARHLPHFSQDGVIQFITFRLGDSLPQNKLEEMRAEKAAFANLHPQPWDETTTNRYYKTRNKKIEYWLEQGYGDCVLREPEARQILADALKEIDGVQYQLLGYVIMPNHVHVLMLPLPGYDCVKAIGSVKQYSARRINKLFGRTGRLWNDESFDRMIRSGDHFDNCLRYIKENPCHVPSDEFTLYFNYDLINAISRRRNI